MCFRALLGQHLIDRLYGIAKAQGLISAELEIGQLEFIQALLKH